MRYVNEAEKMKQLAYTATRQSAVALKRWIGSAKSYEGKLEFALAAEGMKQADNLRAAGWGSLSDYVKANAKDCRDGLREVPTGFYGDVLGNAPSQPAALSDDELNNPSDHGDSGPDARKEIERRIKELEWIKKGYEKDGDSEGAKGTEERIKRMRERLEKVSD